MSKKLNELLENMKSMISYYDKEIARTRKENDIKAEYYHVGAKNALEMFLKDVEEIVRNETR